MILAKSVSRFARNTVDTLSYTRELRSMGIPVIFEEQNINSIYPESEFLITIHGSLRTVRKRRDILPRQVGQASGDANGKSKHPVQDLVGI